MRFTGDIAIEFEGVIPFGNLGGKLLQSGSLSQGQTVGHILGDLTPTHPYYGIGGGRLKVSRGEKSSQGELSVDHHRGKGHIIYMIQKSNVRSIKYGKNENNTRRGGSRGAEGLGDSRGRGKRPYGTIS